jgi:UDP-N-acetylmuramoylalanine--D-glutamate ligase
LGREDNKNIILIMGGDDKKLEMSELVSEIPRWCSKVVLFKERGTDTVREAIFKLADTRLEVFEEDGLDKTVERAFSLAKDGDIILYSPAFSSFGKWFKNEYDRGDKFMEIVRRLE